MATSSSSEPSGPAAVMRPPVHPALAGVVSLVWCARLLRPARDQFYGERSGAVRDPFGHEWLVGHSIEAVDPAEMQRRWDAMG